MLYEINWERSILFQRQQLDAKISRYFCVGYKTPTITGKCDNVSCKLVKSLASFSFFFLLFLNSPQTKLLLITKYRDKNSCSQHKFAATAFDKNILRHFITAVMNDCLYQCFSNFF